MKEFRGTPEQFKNFVLDHELTGNWTDTGNGLRFNCSDGGIINWFQSTGTIQYQGKTDAQERLRNILNSDAKSTSATILVKKPTTKEHNKKIFIVHGHDDTSREQLELILSHLGLEPFVLAKTGGGGLTIIEALEKEIQDGDLKFGVVLLTPDDFGYSQKDGATHTKPRARQNVILELGMLMAKIGRTNTVMIIKGNIETPSDTHGILHLPFNNHVKEIAAKLTRRLTDAGFEIDTEKILRATS